MPEAPFGRDEIEKLIPHRPPFLLVDQVLELEPGRRVLARLAIGGQSFLSGHFPGRPIMPGVLMLEALAQAGAIALSADPEYAGRLALFAGIDGVRFRRLVTPGDMLELELTVDRLRRSIGRGTGQARVEGEVAVDATLTFAFDRT